MTMVFRQLYYTSCEHGLLGYGGFQFNAVTPGVPPTVLRAVEDMTYEPPRSMPGDPRPDQLAGYPVAFSHTPDGAGTITARVVFTGADYSGRPGNYFAHALVSDSAQDFGPVLPVELWDAPFWREKPVQARELPPLPGPPPRGRLDRASIGEFVAGADGRVLPVLLSAVGQAMAGGRPVLLAGPDAANNVRWIAAICYLLGDRLARRLSFTTYSHRPAYSRHHLIGVLAGGDTVPADETFHVYDTATGRLPAVPVHPLADLLARAGINQAGRGDGRRPGRGIRRLAPRDGRGRGPGRDRAGAARPGSRPGLARRGRPRGRRTRARGPGRPAGAGRPR
jgi:GTPase-associated protein 1, N-terminal domain type 2/GTPase-associated protein 1, middle domain